MITAPKTTKNANTDTASSSTCTAWVTTRTSSRLVRSSPCTSGLLGEPVAGSSSSSTDRAYSASGVPRHTSTTIDVIDLVVDVVELLGQPGEQEADRDAR